jgi:hypothetical protein
MTDRDHAYHDLADEIQELADALIFDHSSDEQRQRLEQLVNGDPRAGQLYVQYMQETVAIHRSARDARLLPIDEHQSETGGEDLALSLSAPMFATQDDPHRRCRLRRCALHARDGSRRSACWRSSV